MLILAKKRIQLKNVSNRINPARPISGLEKGPETSFETGRFRTKLKDNNLIVWIIKLSCLKDNFVRMGQNGVREQFQVFP